LINVDTVFVLGAGASQPFGLPLGVELYRDVIDHFIVNGANRKLLLDTTSHREGQLDNFLNALRRSGLTSVDAFLERRYEEFLDIGKAAMAIELLLREQEGLLWNVPNWMLYLYGRMGSESFAEFSNNDVSFVTFNYDRSLEHFLCTSLANSYGRSTEEVAEAMKTIPVVHLHGRLGYLPWEDKNGRAYGDKTIDNRIVELCVKEMRVVHEDITDRDAIFTEAKRLLKKAKRVYLMGFGFGNKNVERIDLPSLTPEVFYGTAYGMTQAETVSSAKLCGRRVSLYNSYPCLELLREQAQLDWRTLDGECRRTLAPTY
jgi:hypothetical protein